jgi:hypothetical protein
LIIAVKLKALADKDRQEYAGYSGEKALQIFEHLTSLGELNPVGPDTIELVTLAAH